MSEGPSAALRLVAEGKTREAVLLGVQLAGTLAVLAFVPGNYFKLLALAALWVVTFRRIDGRELVCSLAVCALFTLMNIAAIRQGVFAFHSPDYFGLPAWEFFMWGFYVLHTTRLLVGPMPKGARWKALLLAVAFALPFATLSDANALLIASGLVLALSIAAFHDPWDLRYAAYLLVLGAMVEYAGVWSGQWSYPGDPPGGVPAWFATMWAGVGLFTRRLLVPLLHGKRPA